MVDGVIAPLVSVLRPLATAVGAIMPHLKIVGAERTAARNPFATPDGQRALDGQFADALARLGAIQNNLAWWQRLLHAVGQQFVQPELFEVHAIREWLGDAEVQKGMIALARAQLQALPEPPGVRAILRQTYSKMTLEADNLAEGPIDIVVAVLLAGRLAALSREGEVLLDGIQGISQQVAGIDAKLDLALAPTGAGHPIIDQAVQNALRSILCRRGIPFIDTRADIRALLDRMENGDLSLASRSLYGEVLHWAARLHASEADTVDVAATYLERAVAIDPGATHGTLSRAWLLFHAGNTDEARKLLRGHQSPHAHATMLNFIIKTAGDQAALQWVDGQGAVGVEFFTPGGWTNVAILMHEARRWDDALGIFDKLTDEHFSEHPDAAYVQGTIHAGYLLPESFRLNALKFTIVTPRLQVLEGADADRHRAGAIACFKRAKILLMEVGAQDRVQACDYWLLWLGLSDPRTKAETAIELQRRMEEGGDSLNFVDLAITHGVAFNVDAAEQHFRVRQLEGGLTPQEQVGLLSLLRFRASPQRLLDHLDSAAEELKEIAPPSHLAMMRVEALIEAGSLDDAEEILNHDAAINADPEAARARLAIADRRGHDVIGDAIRLYEQSRADDSEGHRLGDLKNVVNVLLRDKRWNKLLPFAEELFRLERTGRNLGLVTDCTTFTQGHRVTIEILDVNYDLLRIDDDVGRHLLEKKAHSLFHLGMFKEAREINDRLLAFSDEADYVHHDLNIALRSGDWEHFAAVLDRQYNKRDTLDPMVLMRLAHLVGYIMPDRAIELLKTVAEKTPNDVGLLLGCYSLASQIGREREADKWLAHALNLSKEGGGPLQTMSLREIVERAPAHAQENGRISRQFYAGELPAHLAAYALHIQMARIFVMIPRANERERDARKRTIIPIRAGNRVPADIAGNARPMAFDVSTLLLLEELGLLDAMVAEVGHVKISPRVMDFLAREIRALPYHQPSLVAEARTLVGYVDRGRINVLSCSLNTDPRDEAEFGEEMARLIAAANAQGGRLVTVAQVYKAGSLMEEVADWGEASPLVLSTIQLAEGLRNLGHIDQETFDTGRSFLQQQDRGVSPGPELPTMMPLFIDNLALNYLGHAGLLEALVLSGMSLTIDVSTEQRARDLINADEEGTEAAKVLDALRRRIADHYRKSSMSFLPEARLEGEDKDEKEDRMTVLYDLFHDLSDVGAVVIDDRTLGRNASATDVSGRSVPVLCIIDLLCLPGVSREQRIRAFRHLWRRGYVFLPLLHDQLLTDLLACPWNAETGTMQENAEVRSIRETLCGIRSLKILRVSDEHPWLDHLAQTACLTIVEVWKDEACSEAHARAISNWLVENVTPWPVDWQDSLSEGHWVDLDLGMAQRLFQLLLLRPREASAQRREAFARWVEDRLVRPFLTANPRVVDIAARLLAQIIENGVKEITDESEG